MRTINIRQAKTRLSCLVEEAAKGEPFIIAKAGKPIVKVTAIETPAGAPDTPARLSGRSSDPRFLPAYSTAEAARYLGMPAETLGSWVMGRLYPASGQQKRSYPLIQLYEPACRSPTLLRGTYLPRFGAAMASNNVALGKLARGSHRFRSAPP